MGTNILGYGPPSPPTALPPLPGANAPGRNRAQARGPSRNPSYRAPNSIPTNTPYSGDPRAQDSTNSMGYQRPQGGSAGGAGSSGGATAVRPPTPLRNYFQPAYIGPNTIYGGQTFKEGRYIYRTPQQIRDEMVAAGRSGELGNSGADLVAYTNWYNQVVAPWLTDNPEGDVLLGGLQPFDPLAYANGANPYAEDPNAQNNNDAILQATNSLLMALSGGGLGPSADPAMEQRLAALEQQQQQPQIPPELIAALLANPQNDEQQMYSSSYFGGYY